VSGNRCSNGVLLIKVQGIALVVFWRFKMILMYDDFLHEKSIIFELELALFFMKLGT